jgi:hypothetical protein
MNASGKIIASVMGCMKDKIKEENYNWKYSVFLSQSKIYSDNE